MPDARLVLSLRRSVLAACVLHDLDATPCDSGVAVRTAIGRELEVDWGSIASVVAGTDGDLAAWRLARAMQTLVFLDGTTGDSAEPRLVALPPGHACHPGEGWASSALPGGVLDVGVGLLGLGPDPDDVWPLTPLAVRLGLLAVATVDGWWIRAVQHADRMGRLLLERLAAGRPGPAGTGAGAVLRPFGGVDVLGLLAVRSVRERLAHEDGTGMRAVAVPDRTRGWLDPSRIDPAFVGAAWTATDPPRRGLAVPLLVTEEEVGAARPLGDVVAQGLDLPRPWLRRPLR